MGLQRVKKDWTIELNWISIAFPGAKYLDVQLSINRMVSIVLFDGIVMKMKWGQEFARMASFRSWHRVGTQWLPPITRRKSVGWTPYQREAHQCCLQHSCTIQFRIAFGIHCPEHSWVCNCSLYLIATWIPKPPDCFPSYLPTSAFSIPLSYYLGDANFGE